DPEVSSLLEKPLLLHLRVDLLGEERPGGRLDGFPAEDVDLKPVGVLAGDDFELDRLAGLERAGPQVVDGGKGVEDRRAERDPPAAFARGDLLLEIEVDALVVDPLSLDGMLF